MPENVSSKFCKNCEKAFQVNPSRKTKVFCCHNCGVAYRTKHVYKHRYTVAHRGRNPESFLKALRVKKSDRRDLEISFLLDLYKKQKGLCAISGVPMTYTCGKGVVDTNISIDRIDSDQGYEEGNIQLVCRRVNLMKLNKNKEDLLFWCRSIIENNEKP